MEARDYSKKVFAELASKMIEEYKAYISALQVFKEVAQNFEGKVLNVRFEKEVNSKMEVLKDGRKRFEFKLIKDFATTRFAVYMGKRSADLKSDPMHGYYLDSLMALDIYLHKDDQCVTEENKICKKGFWRVSLQQEERAARQIARLQDAVENWDNYTQMLQVLQGVVDSTLSKINPMFRPSKMSISPEAYLRKDQDYKKKEEQQAQAIYEKLISQTW